MALICRSVLGQDVFNRWVDSMRVASYGLAFGALNRWLRDGFAVAVFSPEERLHEMSPSFVRAVRKTVYRLGIQFFSIGEYTLRGGYTARQGTFTVLCDPCTDVLSVWNRESDPIFFTTEKEIADALVEIGKQLKMQRKMESRVREAILTLAEMAEEANPTIIAQPIKPIAVRLTPIYQALNHTLATPAISVVQVDHSEQASLNYHRIPASSSEPETARKSKVFLL